MHFFDPITDFIFIENEPEPADVIFIPGGPCGEIALHACRAFPSGLRPSSDPFGLPQHSRSCLSRSPVAGKIPRQGISHRG